MSWAVASDSAGSTESPTSDVNSRTLYSHVVKRGQVPKNLHHSQILPNTPHGSLSPLYRHRHQKMIRHQQNRQASKNYLSRRPPFLAFGTVLHDIQAPGFVALVLMCFATIILVRIRITTLTIPRPLSSC